VFCKLVEKAEEEEVEEKEEEEEICCLGKGVKVVVDCVTQRNPQKISRLVQTTDKIETCF
jgi:hypothetical protein